MFPDTTLFNTTLFSAVSDPTLYIRPADLLLAKSHLQCITPKFLGASGGVGAVLPNAAVTVMFAERVIRQLPNPEHPGPELVVGLIDQPVKVEPTEGAAVRSIVVPRFAVSEQSVPQLIVSPVTVPLPVPALVTVKVSVATGGGVLVNS